MPGVKAILLPEDVPGPKDQVNDMGQTLRANPYSERALATEPLYQGEPVLAVCAVDEATAAEAIERIKIKWDVLPFNVDPVETLRPGAKTARVEGNVWVRPTPTPGQPPPLPQIKDLKWTEEQFAETNEGRMPMGEATDPVWSYGDLDAGFKKAALVLDETFMTPNTSHQCLESRSCMAYWQNDKLHIHLSTQSTIQTVNSIARWLSLEPTDIVLDQRVLRWRYGSKATGSVTDIIPALLAKKTGTPVMMRLSREEEHSVGRARPAIARAHEGRLHERRPHHGGRHVHHRRRRAVRPGRRRQLRQPLCVADVPARGDAVARHYRDHQHAAARRAEPARRHAGHHDHGADSAKAARQARHRSGRNSQDQLARG